jgi:hypothetical protein
VVALTLVVAGCGGGGRAKSSTSTAAARSSTSSSAAPPASSQTTPPTTTATGAGPPGDAYWPYAKLVAHLAGRTITLTNATVRLDSALLECNGEGPARQQGPTRAWSRYTCTQTVFQTGIDHDITFDVVISSATQLTIESARTGPE